MPNFITKKSFIYNLTVAILVAISLILVLFFSLGILTKHGNSVKVPNVVGMPYDKAIAVIEHAGLQAYVQDSLYYDSLPKLSVVMQTPTSAIKGVKSDRIIYLTINRAKPPLVEMPDLRGYSLNSAELLLKSYGLKSGEIRYIPDLGKDVVREQRLDSLTSIEPGTKLPVGTSIQLYIGDGRGSATIQVPNLINMTYLEAKQYLASMNLKIGNTYLDAGVLDTNTAIVYKQDPEREFRDELKKGTRRTRVKNGYPINIWLSAPSASSIELEPTPPNFE